MQSGSSLLMYQATRLQAAGKYLCDLVHLYQIARPYNSSHDREKLQTIICYSETKSLFTFSKSLTYFNISNPDHAHSISHLRGSTVMSNESRL
jgi:hypothetical protein